MKGKGEMVSPIIQNISVASSKTPAASGTQPAGATQIVSGIAGALSGKNINKREAKKTEAELKTSDEKAIDTSETKVDGSFQKQAMAPKRRKEPGKGDQIDIIV